VLYLYCTQEVRPKERESMKKYRLVDYYEGEPELICESDDFAEIKLAAKQYREDTDGECLLYVEEELL